MQLASLELKGSVMAGSGGSPQKIDLNLPNDYLSKPTAKFVEWLEDNTISLRILSEQQIILKARSLTALTPDLSRLNDGDLAAYIREWAKSHGFVLPGSGGSVPAPGDPEVLERLKKLFASFPPRWVIGDGRGPAIEISGLTAALKSGPNTISLGTNGIQLKTQSSGMSFSASIGPQNWTMTFTIGRMAPKISDYETVFTKGEAAIRGVLSNLDKVDFRDPGKTKTKLSPYLTPITTAIGAAASTAAMRPGDVSFAAWMQGGGQGGVPGAPGAGGVMLTIVF
jgi:hypothetical protein